MKLQNSLGLLLSGLAGCFSLETEWPAFDTLLTADQLTEWLPRSSLQSSIVLALTGEASQDRAAAQSILADFDTLDYWIEIARCPELADAHPEWMASLQGHGEWRRRFPDAPTPGAGEVIKNYPWVPIAYAEAFDAHLARVKRMLSFLPKPRRIYLNDLQGAPSACGCGNDVCRWTSDYGPLRTATPLGPNAAARFVCAVAELAPESEVVPVWTAECAQGDADCAGVACYGGRCWQAWTEQLMPLERVAPLIAVLAHRRACRPAAGGLERTTIVSCSLSSFQTEPLRSGGRAIPRRRLIPIFPGAASAEQGADFSSEPTEFGITEAGWVIAPAPLDQTWQPRLVRLKAEDSRER